MSDRSPSDTWAVVAYAAFWILMTVLFLLVLLMAPVGAYV